MAVLGCTSQPQRCDWHQHVTRCMILHWCSAINCQMEGEELMALLISVGCHFIFKDGKSLSTDIGAISVFSIILLDRFKLAWCNSTVNFTLPVFIKNSIIQIWELTDCYIPRHAKFADYYSLEAWLITSSIFFSNAFLCLLCSCPQDPCQMFPLMHFYWRHKIIIKIY